MFACLFLTAQNIVWAVFCCQFTVSNFHSFYETLYWLDF